MFLAKKNFDQNFLPIRLLSACSLEKLIYVLKNKTIGIRDFSLRKEEKIIQMENTDNFH